MARLTASNKDKLNRTAGAVIRNRVTMTIAHIGPPHLPILYNLGGATERRIRETAARQAQAGSRVIIYSAEDRNGSCGYMGAEVRAIACHGEGVLRARDVGGVSE